MIQLMRLSPALALVAAFALAGTSAAQGELTGPARVIDGDTIEVSGQRVRMHGIDSPESEQKCLDAAGTAYPCGQAASNALASMVGRGAVGCRVRDKDRHGRLIAVCYRHGVDLGAWMVRKGHALAYRRYSGDYVSHENAARAARVGIWQGRFVAPWDWRRGVR